MVSSAFESLTKHTRKKLWIVRKAWVRVELTFERVSEMRSFNHHLSQHRASTHTTYLYCECAHTNAKHAHSHSSHDKVNFPVCGCDGRRFERFFYVYVADIVDFTESLFLGWKEYGEFSHFSRAHRKKRSLTSYALNENTWMKYTKFMEINV